MKYLMIIAIICLFLACNTKRNKNDQTHGVHADSTGVYNMLFTIEPATPIAGITTKISLRPVKTNKDSIVALEIQHEKKIHLIEVSEDLSLFKHLHPVEQADGTYGIVDTFQQGGNYVFYADYKPANAEKQVTLQKITVSGKQVKPMIYETQKLKNTKDGYTVELQMKDTVIVSNKEIMFGALISNSGGILSPDSLENYLGEKAHMVIIGMSNRKYLHVHPMLMENELMLHTTFPEAGIYRAWLEFKRGGKVNVADFVIKVAPDNAAVQ